MESNRHSFAVLTGDIVRSSKLSPDDLKKTMQRLRDNTGRIEKTFPGTVYGTLDVFSGDGWQLLIKDLKRSLRMALFLRAVIKSDVKLKLDTRIALGWGAVDQDILNPNRISESTGEAFTLSGRALQNMEKHSRFVVSISDDLSTPATRMFQAAIGLLDELLTRATPRQMQALSLALLDKPQEKIAEETGKSQSTINQALQTAAWRSIEKLIQETEYRF